jgi:hypothetical protein
MCDVHPRIDDRLWGCHAVSLKVDDIGQDLRPIHIGTQHESLRDASVARWCAIAQTPGYAGTWAST